MVNIFCPLFGKKGKYSNNCKKKGKIEKKSCVLHTQFKKTQKCLRMSAVHPPYAPLYSVVFVLGCVWEIGKLSVHSVRIYDR